MRLSQYFASSKYYRENKIKQDEKMRIYRSKNKEKIKIRQRSKLINNKIKYLMNIRILLNNYMNKIYLR